MNRPLDQAQPQRHLQAAGTLKAPAVSLDLDLALDPSGNRERGTVNFEPWTRPTRGGSRNNLVSVVLITIRNKVNVTGKHEIEEKEGSHGGWPSFPSPFSVI